MSNYEKKHGLKDGKKVNVEDDHKTLDNEDEPADMPAWAKALIASNKALANEARVRRSGFAA